LTTLQAFTTFLSNLALLSALPLIWWAIFHRKKEGFFSFVGLTRPRLGVPIWGLALFLAVYILYWWYGFDCLEFLVSDRMKEILADNESVTNSSFTGAGWPGFPAALIIGMLANGFCEELLYRGFVQKRLSAKLGATGGILLTATLFGLMHNGMLLLAGIQADIGYHVYTFLSPFFGALLLGAANEKIYTGSIVPSILLHGIGNTISYAMALFR